MNPDTFVIGDRVGCVWSSTPEEIEFAGYGAYAGWEVPPLHGAGDVGTVLHAEGRPNPKITLDNGETIYGCMCWWGPESKVRVALAVAQANGVTVTEIGVAAMLEREGR